MNEKKVLGTACSTRDEFYMQYARLTIASGEKHATGFISNQNFLKQHSFTTRRNLVHNSPFLDNFSNDVMAMGNGSHLLEFDIFWKKDDRQLAC